MRYANGSLIGQVSSDRSVDYEYDSAGWLTDVYFDDGTYIGYSYDGLAGR